MRKIAAIFFLSLFTFSSTEAGQLLKLPLLAHHFSDHKREGRSSSFYSFLLEHYTNDHGNDSDFEEDSQLPFKTLNKASLTSIFLIPDPVEMENAVPGVSNIGVAHMQDPGLSNYHAEIFHPPSQV